MLPTLQEKFAMNDEEIEWFVRYVIITGHIRGEHAMPKFVNWILEQGDKEYWVERL